MSGGTARDWFARNVAEPRLTIRLPLELGVNHVHVRDDVTGAFEASIGNGRLSGSLARRRRAMDPWEMRWAGTVHRWSTGEHDWAVSLHGVEFDPAGLAELQRALGAAPVTRE